MCVVKRYPAAEKETDTKASVSVRLGIILTQCQIFKIGECHATICSFSCVCIFLIKFALIQQKSVFAWIKGGINNLPLALEKTDFNSVIESGIYRKMNRGSCDSLILDVQCWDETIHISTATVTFVFMSALSHYDIALAKISP